MPENDYVVIIGSANMDVAGYSNVSLNYADSNPGKIKYTPGGVGRNIAQNIALLNKTAWLLSVVGDDFLPQNRETVAFLRVTAAEEFRRNHRLDAGRKQQR